jgi:hypothetical protein
VFFVGQAWTAPSGNRRFAPNGIVIDALAPGQQRTCGHDYR